MPGECCPPLAPLCRQHHQLLWRCQRTHFSLVLSFWKTRHLPMPSCLTPRLPRCLENSVMPSGRCWPLASSCHPHCMLSCFPPSSAPCLVGRPAHSLLGLYTGCLCSSWVDLIPSTAASCPLGCSWLLWGLPHYAMKLPAARSLPPHFPSLFISPLPCISLHFFPSVKM